MESDSVSLNVDELVEIEAPELVAAKRTLLGLFSTSSFDWKSWDRSPLLPALRIYHFNDRELGKYRAFLLYDSMPFHDKLGAMGVVSPRNEQRCLIFLWKRLSALTASASSFSIPEIQDQLRSRMESLLMYVLSASYTRFSLFLAAN